MFTVCHMLTSLDGKIDGAFFSAAETVPALETYASLRREYRCQATVYGLTTMLGGYAVGSAPALAPCSDPPAFTDWITPEGKALGNYIISMDPKGELAFKDAVIRRAGRPDAHVVEALTRQASPDYLAYLRRQGISYLIAGNQQLDCTLLTDKLNRLLGVTRLMVAGGGVTNCSFLQAGLLDEISLVIAPVAEGDCTAASVFARAPFLPKSKPVSFRLAQAKPLDGSALWLRYRLSI